MVTTRKRREAPPNCAPANVATSVSLFSVPRKKLELPSAVTVRVTVTAPAALTALSLRMRESVAVTGTVSPAPAPTA